MAIPSSGAISLTTIQTEFGGSNPISLNEYYAGGTYVASGTSGTNGPVPSSGAISLASFYGTSAVTPTIFLQNVVVYSGTGRLARTASVTVNSSGSVSASFNGTDGSITGAPFDWIDIPSLAGNYQIRATLVAGSITSGTLNSWLNLGTSRTWSCTGPDSAYLSITIRDVATQTTQATCNFDITGYSP